jgi:hypothetical protein
VEDRRVSGVVADRTERLALEVFAPLAARIVEQLGWRRLCAALPPAPTPARGRCAAADVVRALFRSDDDAHKAGRYPRLGGPASPALGE